jgi:hypothetical protein
MFRSYAERSMTLPANSEPLSVLRASGLPRKRVIAGQSFLNILSLQALYNHDTKAFPGEQIKDRQQAQSPTIKQGI